MDCYEVWVTCQVGYRVMALDENDAKRKAIQRASYIHTGLDWDVDDDERDVSKCSK